MRLVEVEREACLTLSADDLTRIGHPSTIFRIMSQQKLVYAIIEFLSKSLEDGTVKQDDKEGLEVASTSQKLDIVYDG